MARRHTLCHFLIQQRIHDIVMCWHNFVLFQVYPDDMFENIRNYDVPFPRSMVS